MPARDFEVDFQLDSEELHLVLHEVLHLDDVQVLAFGLEKMKEFKFGEGVEEVGLIYLIVLDFGLGVFGGARHELTVVNGSVRV